MALPVLDGNQTATTLSSVVTGGEHIVAHSVVSLGANAIANITSAVSGSVVSISNFPSTQTIAGSVTIGAGTAQIGSVTASISNSVTISSLPAISGTVTANVGPDIVGDRGGGIVPSNALAIGHEVVGDGFYNVSTDKPLPISGTVTANANYEFEAGGPGQPNNAIQIGYYKGLVFEPVTEEDPLPISGTVTVGAISTSVTARLVDISGTAVSYASTGTAGTPSSDVISVQGVSGGTSLPISGTAGSLTTRFGSVTTAGTAQISSAVTNASRKYLLIQNVTTSSNVITIGIGFTPTTTQGIQLSAGAGITFESSYIPTGAVYILSGVTASPFTILEA